MMDKELLDKYLNDECSSEEFQEVLKWIRQNSLDNKSRDLYADDWQNFVEDDDYEVQYDTVLDKIHHKINLSKSLNINDVTSNKFITWLTRAAAMLLFPALGFLFYFMKQSNENDASMMASQQSLVDTLEVIAPIGSRAVVNLADGTKVYLNHGSKLLYPNKFMGPSREVTLLGEGYFQVAHNEEIPFVVNSGNFRIKALGTTFNVLAYPDRNIIETTLVEGKVRMEKQVDGSDVLIGEMNPGQHAEYNLTTNAVSYCDNCIDMYVAWKDGKMIFRNESIVEILQRLGRWYNVDFVIVGQDLADYTYSATFTNETVYQILDLMKMASPIQYKVVERAIQPDGSFARQQIIVSKTRK